MYVARDYLLSVYTPHLAENVQPEIWKWLLDRAYLWCVSGVSVPVSFCTRGICGWDPADGSIGTTWLSLAGNSDVGALLAAGCGNGSSGSVRREKEGTAVQRRNVRKAAILLLLSDDSFSLFSASCELWSGDIGRTGENAILEKGTQGM